MSLVGCDVSMCDVSTAATAVAPDEALDPDTRRNSALARIRVHACHIPRVAYVNRL